MPPPHFVPFLRRVRETATYLDLEVEVYPCPKDSEVHRKIVKEMGGKETFPFLVDLNAGDICVCIHPHTLSLSPHTHSLIVCMRK